MIHETKMPSNSGLNSDKLSSKNVFLVFLCFFSFAAILSCIAVLWLGEDLDFDNLYYHFYTGYVWSHGLAFKDSLANRGSYLEVQLNCFFYYLLAKTSPIFSSCAIAIIESISISATWILGFLLLKNEKTGTRIFLSSLFATLVFLGPVFWSEIGTTMGDTVTAAIVIISLIVALDGYTKKQYLKIVISGVLIGVAAGLKLTNLTFFFGILGAIFLSSLYNFDFKRNILFASAFCIAFLAFFVIVYYPTGITLIHHYQNPFFPFFNKIFKSPYEAATNLTDDRWPRHGLMGFLKLPFQFIIQSFVNKPHANVYIGLEIQFKTLYIAAIAVVSPLFLAWQFIKKYSKLGRQSTITADDNAFVFVFSFLICSLFVWEIMFAYYRYFAPVEIVSPCILGVLLFKKTKWIKKETYKVAFTSTIIVLASLYSLPLNNWGRARYASSYFDINKSELNSYQNSLLIVANQPLSYVLPFFPTSNGIIALPVDNFPATQKFYDSYLRPLHEYKKFFVVSLADSDIFDDSKKTLQNMFNISIDTASCKKYTSIFEPFVVCPAHIGNSP